MTSSRTPKLWISAICLWLLAFGAALADNRKDEATDSRELDQIFRRSSIQIATPDARLHRFNVWIADDEARRARGLMFVKHLNGGDGMLFLYPEAQTVGIWMKNTFIPLDILFVEPNGKVVRVFENAEPHSLKAMESGGPVLGVVELAGGTAARLKIAPGAQVIHPAFAKR